MSEYNLDAVISPKKWKADPDETKEKKLNPILESHFMNETYLEPITCKFSRVRYDLDTTVRFFTIKST